MQKLPTGMQRRPPAPHQAEIARIRASGRAARALQALDAYARHRGWPARQEGESRAAYLARLRREGLQGDSTP